MQFGTYDRLHFCAEVPHHGETAALDEAGVDAFVRAHPDLESQVQRALRDVTLLHETRHFHDCFGTMSGLYLFDLHLSRLEAFGNVLRRLREDDVRMQLPLSEWSLEAECPDYVKDFTFRIRNGKQLEAAFDGHYPVHTLAGVHSAAHVDLKYGSSIVPGFPAHIRMTEIDEDGLTVKRDFTRVMPVGFEQLIEGNAQALQRTMLHAVWPEAVAAEVWRRSLVAATADVGNASDTLASLDTRPYDTTDLMLSKHLRTRYRINEFPRRWLTQLTDLALMEGRIPMYGTKSLLYPPGGAFVHQMEQLDWSAQDPAGRLTLPDQSSATSSLLSALRASPAPETCLPAKSLSQILGYIRSYAYHCVAAPIFELRLSLGAGVMDDGMQYSEHFAQLPSAPWLATRHGLHAPDVSLPEGFALVWSRYAMFSRMALDIWADRAFIPCPRQSLSVSALRGFDFMFTPTETCDSNIKAARCEPWHAGVHTPMLDCYFTASLRLFGLVPAD